MFRLDTSGAAEAPGGPVQAEQHEIPQTFLRSFAKILIAFPKEVYYNRVRRGCAPLSKGDLGRKA